MSLNWVAVQALLDEPVRGMGDFSTKLTRNNIYLWGHVLVPGWNEFNSRAKLTPGQQDRVHGALFELNGWRHKSVGGEVGFRTTFIPKIRTRYGNFDVSDERYENIFALDLSRFEWKPEERKLMALLDATKVGHLCQRRWEVELMPAAEHIGMGKEGLRAMERGFQWHVERLTKTLLCFDMDLPGPFSKTYPRTQDAPWPWMDPEALRRFAMATVGRRRIVRP